MSEDWGLKIAQTGNDVKTCADNKLVYSSKYPQLKIHSTGSGTYVATGDDVYGFTETLTTHDLGYRPFFVLLVDTGDGYEPVNVGFSSGTYSLSIYGTSKVDTLVLGMTSIDTSNPLWEEPVAPDDPLNIDYAWIIFYDPLQDE